jgi:hypothetical protein
MILTDDEKRMRDGAEGAAVVAAMDLLIRYGDALACERLCDVRNVAGSMTQPSPVKERLVREGGWDKAFAVINLDCDDDIEVPAMRVPVCQLQHGFGSDAAGIVPCPAPNIELQADAESFYGRRGVNILATCTPYQVGNIPVRGEHLAWMESSAVIYANSVLGARTNCEGLASGGVELYHIPGLTPEAPTLAAACWATRARPCPGPSPTGPGSSPPTRPSKPATCPPSAVSRPGSAPSRTAWTPPSPAAGTALWNTENSDDHPARPHRRPRLRRRRGPSSRLSPSPAGAESTPAPAGSPNQGTE